jgi:hypothetical protein
LPTADRQAAASIQPNVPSSITTRHQDTIICCATKFYGRNAQFSVYRSKNPLDFGKDNDRYLIEKLPYAAPEVVEFEGQTFLAVLLPTLKGIQMAKLKWVPK